MIVTVTTYQTTTGDTSTWAATVSAKLEEAQERLEEVLDRPLDAAVRSEVMIPYRDGSLSPRVTPVTVADGWTIDGDRLIMLYPNAIGAALTWWPQLGPTVTYTGGWVERTANPTAPNRLPVCISDDLCWTAWRLLNPVDPAALTAYPPGAASVQLGDAAVTFGPGGAPSASGRQLSAVRWSPATLRYRFRANRGVGC